MGIHVVHAGSDFGMMPNHPQYRSSNMLTCPLIYFFNLLLLSKHCHLIKYVFYLSLSLVGSPPPPVIKVCIKCVNICWVGSEDGGWEVGGYILR
jgi:hypothetical protein